MAWLPQTIVTIKILRFFHSVLSIAIIQNPLFFDFSFIRYRLCYRFRPLPLSTWLIQYLIKGNHNNFRFNFGRDKNRFKFFRRLSAWIGWGNTLAKVPRVTCRWCWSNNINNCKVMYWLSLKWAFRIFWYDAGSIFGKGDSLVLPNFFVLLILSNPCQFCLLSPCPPLRN